MAGALRWAVLEVVERVMNANSLSAASSSFTSLYSSPGPGTPAECTSVFLMSCDSGATYDWFAHPIRVSVNNCNLCNIHFTVSSPFNLSVSSCEDIFGLKTVSVSN